MKITPYAQKPYHPFLLSNGNDAAFVGYCGSMYTAYPNHFHGEGHQCVSTGWYKSSTRMPEKPLTVSLQTGYDLVYNGIIAEPRDYQQEFFPKRAILVSELQCLGVHWRITSFMARGSLFVEHYEIIAKPEKVKIDFAFRIKSPTEFCHLTARTGYQVLTFSQHDNIIDIAYSPNKTDGTGFMCTDARYDRMECSESGAEIRFENLETGWSASKFLSLIDCRDSGSLAQNIERCRAGYDHVLSEHEVDWRGYSEISSVSLPDEEMQHLLDMSLYLARAHIHPDSGALTCGMLPNHWGGGVFAPGDANLSLGALFTAGRIADAKRVLEFYRKYLPEGRKFAESQNLPGSALPVWSNCFGEHLGLNPGLEWYLMYAKGSQVAGGGIAIYWLFQYSPDEAAEYYGLYNELARFIRAAYITADGMVKDCKAGDESERKAKNDTLALVLFGNFFKGFEEISAALDKPVPREFQGLGKKLLGQIQQNIKDDILYSDDSLQCKGSVGYYSSLPDSIPPFATIEKYLSDPDIRTPWGFGHPSPMSGYREWPWNGAKFAIAIAHNTADQAFTYLMHCAKFASAAGALPEKIRLDGYPINYYYSSAHGVFAWAMLFGLCHTGKDGNLRLLFGLDGSWKNLDFQGIRAMGGLEVSVRVCDGTVTSLQIVNHSSNPKKFSVKINPSYKTLLVNTEIAIDPHQRLSLI